MGFAAKHWIAMIVFLAVGYFLGKMYPNAIKLPMKVGG